MIRRSTKVALEVILALTLLVAVPVGVFLWRLASEPVALDFLSPYLEEAFEDALPKSQVTIGGTQLQWRGWSHSLNLEAKGVQILGAEGEIGLSLPSLSLRLSTRALTHGVVTPTIVEVRDAALFLVRELDGTIRLEYGAVSPTGPHPEGDIGLGLWELLARVAPTSSVDRPLTLLNRVRILESTVLIVDKKVDRVWRFPLSRLEVNRDRDGLSGDFSFTIGSEAAAATIETAFAYDKSAQIIDFAASFGDLEPSILADAFEELEPLGRLETSLGGTLSASLAAEEGLTFVRLAVDAAPGTLALQPYGLDVLGLRSARLIAQLDLPTRRLTMEGLTVNLGSEDDPGPVLKVSGGLDDFPALAASRSQGDLMIEVDRVEVSDLAELWPEGLSDNARDWVVENLIAGRAVDLRATVGLGLSEEKALEVESIEGAFTVEELDLHYVKPLPPITGLGGAMVFDLDTMTFSAETGQVRDLSFADGTLSLLNLDTSQHPPDSERAEIWLSVQGPVRTALELLDHESLDLISDLGLEPTSSAGSANVDLALDFPLLADLEFAQVGISAKGTLSDVGLGDFFLDQDVTQGALTLDLDRSGMQIIGDLALGGVPLEIDWTEAFEQRGDYRSHIKAKIARLDEAARERFGLDLSDYLQGPVAANVFMTLRDDGGGNVKIAANFADARLALDPLGWEKPVAAAAQGRFELDLEQDRIARFSRIEIKASDLAASGQATPSADGSGLADLALDELDFAGGHVNDVSVRFGEKGADIRIGRGWINAEYFLDDEPDDTTTRESEVRDPFTVQADNLERVVLSEGRELHDATLALQQVETGWRRLLLRGRLAEPLRSPPIERRLKPATSPFPGRQRETEGLGSSVGESTDDEVEEIEVFPPPDPALLIDFGPDPEVGQRLLVETEDFGGALKLLNISDAVVAGKIRIEGQGEGPYPAHALKVKVRGKDFLIVEGPTAEKILSLTSYSDIQELLDGEGLLMRRLKGGLTLEDNKIRTELVRMFGSELGVTARGQLDLDKDWIKLEGTLVPAYSINSILGEIPLLGPLLVGGEGGGILAVVYTLEGPPKDPEVNVNPLSALAPGFLRGLFSGEGIFEGESEEEPRAMPRQIGPSIAPRSEVD
jgi:hypothetical protein